MFIFIYYEKRLIQR